MAHTNTHMPCFLCMYGTHAQTHTCHASCVCMAHMHKHTHAMLLVYVWHTCTNTHMPCFLCMYGTHKHTHAMLLVYVCVCNIYCNSLYCTACATTHTYHATEQGLELVEIGSVNRDFNFTYLPGEEENSWPGGL